MAPRSSPPCGRWGNGNGGATIGRGPVANADLVIETGPAFKTLLAREIAPPAALKKRLVRINGDPKLLDRFVRMFRIERLWSRRDERTRHSVAAGCRYVARPKGWRSTAHQQSHGCVKRRTEHLRSVPRIAAMTEALRIRDATRKSGGL
jgi:hypothetical protein